ncbi:MAG: flavin reductase [Bacteroidia bacterium]|nr:flavin reductase [Bacteroidia bacterium]
MAKQFSVNDILQFDQRYRATFINSLGGFKSLVLIGTINKKKQSNLAVFNSFFHLGASPPLFGFIIRPDSAERHTLDNILSVKEFTVNHVNESFYKQAHQTSARYPQDISEFDATSLTAEYKTNFAAPFVAESNIKIGARFERRVDIIENGTILIIASIISVSLPDDCILEDGYINLEKAGTITCSGLDSYHKTTRIARLSYAKPNLPLAETDEVFERADNTNNQIKQKNKEQ